MKYSPIRILDRITKFYREHSQLELLWADVHYSQFGEDVFLRHLLPQRDHGFYVDVGAYHPYYLSNTYLFHRLGWRGINIEPNPRMFKLLQKWRNDDFNINCAVSAEEGSADYVVEDVFSGIRDEHRLRRQKGNSSNVIQVSTRPLRSILAENIPPKMHIDFMSVDCEGHDEIVLRSNDWTRFRPSVVLVEDHTRQPVSDLNRHMETYGYKYYCRLSLTKVFLDEDYAHDHLPVGESL